MRCGMTRPGALPAGSRTGRTMPPGNWAPAAPAITVWSRGLFAWLRRDWVGCPATTWRCCRIAARAAGASRWRTATSGWRWACIPTRTKAYHAIIRRRVAQAVGLQAAAGVGRCHCARTVPLRMAGARRPSDEVFAAHASRSGSD
jgi:hypothetical protein